MLVALALLTRLNLLSLSNGDDPQIELLLGHVVVESLDRLGLIGILHMPVKLL